MTHRELEAEVWQLFDMLDDFIRGPIRKRWLNYMSADKLPQILSDPEHVDAATEFLGFEVDIAATDGICMYFRLDRMTESGSDARLIILHEWAHCYLFATHKFTLHQYREDAHHRKKCEAATRKLSEMWFKRVQHQDELARGKPLKERESQF